MKFQFLPVEKPADILDSDWNNWTWQLRNSLKNQEDFCRYFQLSTEELQVFSGGKEIFNIRTTPYYATLAKNTSSTAIKKILMPTAQELLPGVQAQLDPLGERKNNPTSRLIHRYPDRVLFLVTDICSVYCRYCTRKHFTGHEQAMIKESEYQAALHYIQSRPGIREVILSGGDPLTLSDSQLDRILSDLRRIEHIEIIRIGTRMPVVTPMRVTADLVNMLKKHRPVYMMTHFNHPKELTQNSQAALDLIVDNGIPTFNQMVLLNGVNNHPAIVQALSRRLIYLRVKPYYMFQCDPSQGTDHLRTSIEDSEAIQKELWGSLSGLAMPNLSLDIPSGGGKVGLTPSFEVSRTSSGRTYQGWDGVTETYLNPKSINKVIPNDFNDYMEEWNQLKNAKQVGKSKSALDEHTLPQIF